MKTIISLLFILIVSLPAFGLSLKAPDGWRFPSSTDMNGQWNDFKKDLPTPYKLNGDFNADNLKDQAWILVPTNGKALGVFVFLQQPNKSFRTIQIDYFEGEKPQDSYLSLAPKGKYDTACGEGYWDCSVNEPPVLNLKNQGILFGVYEGASKIFYWNAERKTFESVAISD